MLLFNLITFIIGAAAWCQDTFLLIPERLEVSHSDGFSDVSSLTDGSPTTYWECTGSSSGFRFCDVDLYFPNDVELTEIYVEMYQLYATYAEFMPHSTSTSYPSFIRYFSKDVWHDSITVRFNNVLINYMKIRIWNKDWEDDRMIKISTIELWGCNSTSILPTLFPTISPTLSPTTANPSLWPSTVPTWAPSFSPTTILPTNLPSAAPSPSPTLAPTTVAPSPYPSNSPSSSPNETPCPSEVPTWAPTFHPTTVFPTNLPSVAPSPSPTLGPTTIAPSPHQSNSPSSSPTMRPIIVLADTGGFGVSLIEILFISIISMFACFWGVVLLVVRLYRRVRKINKCLCNVVKRTGSNRTWSRLDEENTLYEHVGVSHQNFSPKIADGNEQTIPTQASSEGKTTFALNQIVSIDSNELCNSEDISHEQYAL